ncbi:hypothetical protein BBBOND_0404950 [Babesia bigemina]|uniref:Uncharacterized protein n=1 Tax=Babesia bigemina TaxID=5866 RepID=A0A061DEW9_BABBI|nr:hypothetical protein BBBOND_0404950 [Babesia bigemina]CDR98010.1 hypothetical protein BBBOND_0404950 [Babesia bigemina]|eukprot:XP_012770196.1 hypothetical protein BBBOND_0404950 [Babesia bigemina]
MVYNSLTEAPHNLKEGIDWLMALKGTDAKSNLAALGAAIYDFLADKPVGFTEVPALERVKLITKTFLGKSALKGQWFVRRLRSRYDGYMSRYSPRRGKPMYYLTDSDFNNAVKGKGLTADTIANGVGEVVDGCEKFLDEIKNPDRYESAYSSEATWAKSCSERPQACAVVFVGIAPMLYVGLSSLLDASAGTIFRSNNSELSYGSVQTLNAVGYMVPQRRSTIIVSDFLKALEGVSHEVLVTLYDLAGFWAFFGSKNAAVKSGELDKDAQHRIDFYVNMKPINPPKKKLQFIKSPSTYTATGSNNMYYPGVPTVLDMGDTIPL